jgi:hypothetical protein
MLYITRKRCRVLTSRSAPLSGTLLGNLGQSHLENKRRIFKTSPSGKPAVDDSSAVLFWLGLKRMSVADIRCHIVTSHLYHTHYPAFLMHR